MKVINGTYNNAKIFTDVVDDSCKEQIKYFSIFGHNLLGV
jgi:hypothetical protein